MISLLLVIKRSASKTCIETCEWQILNRWLSLKKTKEKLFRMSYVISKRQCKWDWSKSVREEYSDAGHVWFRKLTWFWLVTIITFFLLSFFFFSLFLVLCLLPFYLPPWFQLISLSLNPKLWEKRVRKDWRHKIATM